MIKSGNVAAVTDQPVEQKKAEQPGRGDQLGCEEVGEPGTHRVGGHARRQQVGCGGYQTPHALQKPPLQSIRPSMP